MTDQDEQNEELRSGKGRKSGGAYMGGDTHDPLFRKFMMWTWGSFGLVFMGMQIWLVSNVADIKATLPLYANKDVQLDAHLASTDKRVDRLEDKQDALRSRVDQLDGRGMRGGPEPKRGN
jgi:hypothetical protein